MKVGTFTNKTPEARMRIRFWAIICLVIVSIAGMLFLGKLGMDTLSSMRAYVEGESLYAKRLHSGAFDLLKYADTQDRTHYEEFLTHIQVPLGARQARLALDQPDPNTTDAAQGFKQAGVHPEDIAGLIELFLTFRNFEHVDRAIRIWARADQKVLDLLDTGERLDQLVQSGAATPAALQPILEHLADLDDEVNRITDSFSTTLGEAGRWAKGILVRLLLGFAALSTVICVLALWFGGKLITSIQENARKLEERDWIQSGLADLNEKIRDEEDISRLASNAISDVCKHLDAGVGAVYVRDEEAAVFQMMAGYAFEKRKGLNNQFEIGEGLIGQAALEKHYIIMTGCPDDYIQVNSALGASTPKNIIAYPLIYSGTVKGVMEIGAFHEFSEREIQFLRLASESVAMAISTAEARQKETALLEKTQQQAEELTAQQEELRAANEELEERAQNLKESEQKLQEQQEELRVTNEELAEQAQSLEEQKEEIENKNQELKAAKRTAEEKARELEVTSKYKSEFLANMSHELRTPLNSVLMLSKLLLENKAGNLTEKQAEYAQTIYSSGADLLNLINDVLDLSKIEAGKMEISISSCSLAAFAEKMQRNYEKIAEEKEIEFSVALDRSVPDTIHTDAQKLEQIVKNFISNALKFTEKGRVTLSVGRPAAGVTFSRKELTHEGAIAFSVSDTGIGIGKDSQEAIFEAFQQADGSTSRKYGGTGLGLSISRELAAHLGGEIQFTSQKGKGSTFTLYLPQNRESAESAGDGEKTGTDQPAAGAEARSEQKAAAPAETGSVDAIRDDRSELGPEDKSILIIEDDPVFLKTLKDMAQEKGFKTLVAGDGESGLHLADYYQPSAIILDIGLPGIDGWNVMIRLKEAPGTRHIPVHFISGMEQSRDARRMGAVGYLLKPVSLDQLNHAFETIENMIDTTVKNLLVAEGSQDESARIRDLLTEGDVSVVTVESGEEAIRRLKAETCHCIILGLTLSDMEGTELLSRIREDETISHIPVIVYTEKELTSEQRVFLDSHSERVITKDPKSLERLFDETALFLHRVESELPAEKRQILEGMHDKQAIFKDKKILVTDDDMRNVFALTSILEEKGVHVIQAKNGNEGLARVRENPDLDLVLMDIMMPEMDGYETMRKIREIDEFKQLPIIALTAKAMRGDRAKCIEAGANDYLSKPVDSDKLLSMLRVWLYR